jgi:hypothetical protein
MATQDLRIKGYIRNGRYVRNYTRKEDIANKNKNTKKAIGLATLGLGVLGVAASLRSKRLRHLGDNVPIPSPTKTAAAIKPDSNLQMVVPYGSIKNLKEGQSLSTEDVRKLIDDAPYFKPDALGEYKTDKFKLSDDFSKLSELDNTSEVLVRVRLQGTGDLSKYKIPYSLKQNIPDGGSHLIESVKLIKSLNGLETFTRI